MPNESTAKRILIVDDDPGVTTGFQRYITLWARRHLTLTDLRVEIYHNGDDALKAARRDPPPDFILSDTHMPVLDGLDLLRGVRAHSQVPFVLMSGVGLKAPEAEEVRQLNATYALKPIDLKVLEGFLSQALLPAPKRVCVVADDEAGNRDSLSDFLTHLGFEVLESRDGMETLKHCRSRHVDFIISDFQMGQMDGLRCLLQLRKEDRQVPYLMISGRRDDDVVTYVEQNGASFRLKPLTHDDTKEWLRAHAFLPPTE